ncbi:MAG: heavy metal translocating P-type ATPase [Candidatus Doudnabacteria bacterium]|nr:heavy metal translocating P-type ATPase [Candidatus Doudnabacteria bacterium]
MNKSFLSFVTIPFLTLTGLAVGAFFHLTGNAKLDQTVWMITIIIGAGPLVFRLIKDLLRGHFGVDIIAITAIVTSFILGQYLAGSVIVLMLSGGEALEAYALRRARKELTQLISNAPSVAHIKTNSGLLDVQASEVKIGDIIVIKPGEAVPVDGIVLEGKSEVDESALTGESVPKEKQTGSLLLSGSINKENPLEIKAVRQANESKYEQIIKLIKDAEESRAPVVRLADRYSVWFTAITFFIALLAWLVSHDPVRLLAVLVVATPCPLILATPIAIISGLAKSASRGIIIKSGSALENLAEADAFIFDKTGTLTLGTPEVFKVSSEEKQVLEIATSLDQLSAHILARSLVTYSQKNNVKISYPKNFKEVFGEGVTGEIEGKQYYFGKLKFLQSNGIKVDESIKKSHDQLQGSGTIAVYLGQGEKLLGSVMFADKIRPEIKNVFRDLKNLGMEKIVMLTGDKQSVADNIGRQLGLTDIHAESLPEDKVNEVKDHKKQFGKVAMIGDGVNDAPALAAADVGIALGGHGSTASSDTSDIVITVDNLERVGEAYKIARQVMRIAKQGIFIGMGVSILLMFIAAAGKIMPVYGALLQEVLDVIVILNALRVNFEKV